MCSTLRYALRRKLICLISFILIIGMAGNVSADLVGQWTFDEGTGTTVNDISGNGNDGTFVGDLQWVAGVTGGALEFDGESYVNCGSASSLNVTGPFSSTIWIRPGTLGGPDSQAPMSKATAPDWSWQLRFAWGSGGQDNIIGWQFNSPGGSTWIYIGQELPVDEWYHIAASHDGQTVKCYLDGVETDSATMAGINGSATELQIGSDGWGFDWIGAIDDVRIYDHGLSEAEILGAMAGEVFPYAFGPDPEDGSLYLETWVTLGWKPGGFAISHDVYMGENFDDVNEAMRDSDLFRINTDLEFYIAGFPGYAYETGLIPGTTYYWRIDEVNEAEPNSPWKGEVWSFMVPPKTAYYPVPVDGAELVLENVTLSWTGGFGAKLHTVYFGEDFDTVNNATGGAQSGIASYTPGPLKLAKTYYWRVDEFDGSGLHKGDVWSFTTKGAVSGPNPANGAEDISATQVLTWEAGAVAASHEVYFGDSAEAVQNATTASPEYKGPRALGEESYDPGKLLLNTTYFWRIDEVNTANPDSPWPGNVWSFTTGGYFVIDDFEGYDAVENQIWFSWHDGLGAGAPGTPGYLPGNGTGSAVGDENTASYTEETIVHGGNQSMPLVFDNNKQGYANYSEVELTLDVVRDWTAEGVAELSLWFRGNPASVGGFAEGPAGTYTMTASGADIWNQADEFHFAYKMLTGAGSIIARVESVEQTDNWAKAGVMIRETLDAGSKFAAVYITPTDADGTATNGCRFQARTSTDAAATSDSSVATTEQMDITAPYWVKLERDIGGNFRAYYSANGTAWQSMAWNPQNVSMSSNLYVGLALTSHNDSATCQAKFSGVTITGNVSGQWVSQDIGIESNAAEPLYIAVSNTTGAPAVVVHENPAAATIDTWTEWIIPLSAFADQGINMTDVDKVALGLGTKDNMTVPGGSGKMYFDDVRLNQPAEAAE